MKSNKQLVFPLLLTTSLFCLLACSSQIQVSNVAINHQANNTNSNKFDNVEFMRNKFLWDKQNLKNYIMIVEARNSTNIANQALIEVQNGRATSIKQTPESGTGHVEFYKDYDTVEKMFGIIEQAEKSNAEKIYTIYDKTLGYPLQISIDGRLDTSDDEMSVGIRKLEVKR